MKAIHLVICFCIFCILSCIPYKEIDIQYLRIPEISIPTKFNNPVILINHYENRLEDRRERFEHAIDSLAAEEAALALQENLSNSPLFEGLELPIRKYFRKDSSRYIKPLPWNTIRSIASIDNADLIISLEYLKVIEKTDSYKTQLEGMDYYYGSLNVPIYCYWRVYDIVKNQIPSGYLYRDTLLWEKRDWVPVTIGNQLPGFFSASAYVGNECGNIYASKIAPIWQNGKRLIYHIGSKEMESAAVLAIKGQWIEAAEEWQQIFKLKNSKLSAKASYNLALANEMLGKFDIALEWLRKAKKIYPLDEIDGYINTIEERIKHSLK